MVVNVEPVPFMNSGYSNGARTPSEDALLRRMNAIDEQTKMNQMHAGGAKGGQQIIVPQIYTGVSSDSQLNQHIATANEALIKNETNREFDELALSNKKGGRKRKSMRKTKKMNKSKKTNKSKKSKNTARKTRKHRKRKN